MAPVAASPEAVAAVAAGPARYDGYGQARFGMDPAQVRAAWAADPGGSLEGGEDADQACFHLWPAGQAAPSDLALMFVDGRFVRYSVESGRTVAPGGGHRGLAAADIQRKYPGPVARSPHKYVDGGEYLRVDAPRGDAVLVFETGVDGRVTGWRVGRPPAVDYVEGCS